MSKGKEKGSDKKLKPSKALEMLLLADVVTFKVIEKRYNEILNKIRQLAETGHYYFRYKFDDEDEWCVAVAVEQRLAGDGFKVELDDGPTSVSVTWYREDITQANQDIKQ